MRSAVNGQQPVIRLGLIGCGEVVRRHHWPVLERLSKEIKVVAIAKRHREEVSGFARKAKIPRIYSRYEEMLRDEGVDAVLTAVPIELNAAVLLAAIRAGKHVLAEKPVAATPAEARRVLAAIANREQIVLIGENFRYRRDIAEAARLVRDGAIGTVFAFLLNVRFDIDAPGRSPWISKGWRKSTRHRGGFILDAGVHPVSALRDILGEASYVSAHLVDTSSVIRGPDSVLAQIAMKNGAVGQCFFCYTAKEQRETPLEFSIFGTTGVLRLLQGTITLTSGVGCSPRVLTVPERDGEYFRQWKNFAAAIRGEEIVLSTPTQAYRDLLVIDAILRSSWQRRRVRVSSPH